MIIHWGYLLAGLFFAWLPGKLLRNSTCRYFQCEQLNRRLADKGRRRRRWWKLPAVWIDPIRGYMAVTLLQEGIQRDPLKSAMPVLALTVLILTIGVTVQCAGSRERSHLVAPVGYLAGMLVAWLPWEVSVPALIFGAASAVAFRRWEAGFLTGGAFTLVLGYFFMGLGIPLLWSAGIYVWPVVLALFMQRKLVLAVRI